MQAAGEQTSVVCFRLLRSSYLPYTLAKLSFLFPSHSNLIELHNMAKSTATEDRHSISSVLDTTKAVEMVVHSATLHARTLEAVKTFFLPQVLRCLLTTITGAEIPPRQRFHDEDFQRDGCSKECIICAIATHTTTASATIKANGIRSRKWTCTGDT